MSIFLLETSVGSITRHTLDLVFAQWQKPEKIATKPSAAPDRARMQRRPAGAEEEAVMQQISVHSWGVGFAVVLSIALAMPGFAQEKITFSDIDTVLREHPLPPGPTADIVATRHVDASELQIVVARKIDLHTHDDTDHRVYVARGVGVFHFAGQTRQVKVGDIVTIPKGIVHGFEAQEGSEPLVLLVVETPS
jgi:mannose-6-phosphate isomerase-like protein (cupin superfamily)